MGHGVGLLRRAGTVARWPVGMALTSWRYLWRTTPLHRHNEEATILDEPEIPEAHADERVQRAADGYGPFVRRRYWVEVTEPKLSCEELITGIAARPNHPAPVEVAVFRKTVGEQGPLRAGDEFLVRMPGPWDGPVRVVDRTPTSFRFATLDGHLEAGQIEFRARDIDGLLTFEIESWTTSGDRFCDLLYNRVHLVKEMQLHMWTHFCERAGRIAGGRLRGGVHIETTTDRSER